MRLLIERGENVVFMRNYANVAVAGWITSLVLGNYVGVEMKMFDLVLFDRLVSSKLSPVQLFCFIIL
jgi:hypothetical protein